MPATMKDIARETGLGLATISKYFNGGQVRPRNRKLIEDAVRKLDYVPNEFARSLKTRQSRTVGVVIPELGNAFITSIVTTMEDIRRKHDYAVIVCDCRSDPQREKEAVAYAKTVLQPKGVPAIYINGEKVSLPGYTKDDLIRVLEDEAAKYEDDFGFACGEDGCG